MSLTEVEIPRNPNHLDLHPLHPTQQQVLDLIPKINQYQTRELIAHVLQRAVVFGDIAMVTFLLKTPAVKKHVDLSTVDEDHVGLISQAILGFGEESDKDIDREEVVRLLISEGADILSGDSAGWTPLHFAALHAPPTLISHLLTHGATPLCRSRRGLLPLDVITAYEALPNRAHVALILEEAMREKGWFGSDMERRRERNRRRAEMRVQRSRRRKEEWDRIGSTLDLGPCWWGDVPPEPSIFDAEDDPLASDDEDDEDDEDPTSLYTPPRAWDSIIVFSLSNLPQLLDSLTLQVRPVVRPVPQRSAPANGLYYLARFACLWCDPSWVEEVLVGTVDKIEETIYSRPDDLSHLSFWLYNTTLLLHLIQCDDHVGEICEAMELLDLLEELINAIFVFIIRVIEKRIDPLIDTALLEHSPLASEFDSIKFEDEWTFFKSLTTPKRKGSAPPNGSPVTPTPASQASSSNNKSSPPNTDKSSGKPFSSLRFFTPSNPSSPNPDRGSPTPSSSGFTRNVLSKPPPPQHTPSPRIPDSSPTPTSISVILTALHTLLSLYGVNPALIIQANSQILYWTACEMFNRLISRKKYLCRSRAMQIGMNVGVVEEWVARVGLPKAVGGHFACVRQLLSWLQCLSSIRDFPALIDTIQTMKAINPLQMRKAVKEYRYEVNEGRMTDECNQYLAQMQKDWERQRIKLGVELARKERERDREDEMPSSGSDEPVREGTVSPTKPRETDEAQHHIDNLFNSIHPKSDWMFLRPPEPLGELMNSRFMLPLLLPTDAALLCAGGPPEAMHPPHIFTAGMDSTYVIPSTPDPKKSQHTQTLQPASLAMLRRDNGSGHSRSSSRASHTSSHASMSSMGSVSRGPMRWKDQSRKVREVDLDLLDLVGGAVTKTIWTPFGVRFLNADTEIQAADVVGDWNEESELREDIEVVDGADDVDTTPSTSRVVTEPVEVYPDSPECEGPSGAPFDARSVTSAKSNRSHLTPNFSRPLQEKRRSMRLARRSSGGDTAMPLYEVEDTPVVEQPFAGFA